MACDLLEWATLNRVMINPTPAGGFNASIGRQIVWALTIPMALRALRHATRPTRREMREWWIQNSVTVWSKLDHAGFNASHNLACVDPVSAKTVMGALRKLRRRVEGAK